MTIAEFEAAKAAELDGALLALWWDAQGDWEQAHAVAQDVDGADGAWVHAYLHRKDGDVANAAYWYRVAARSVGMGDFRKEWERIVGELLTQK
jgi:phage major head subunit gpT-like protein